MFDRPDGNAAFTESDEQDAVILVHLNFNETAFDETHEEFIELVNSTGAKIAADISGKRHRPDAKLFAGSGKAEEIAIAVETNHASLVIFNHELSPSQERNLEQKLKCRG